MNRSKEKFFFLSFFLFSPLVFVFEEERFVSRKIAIALDPLSLALSRINLRLIRDIYQGTWSVIRAMKRDYLEWSNRITFLLVVLIIPRVKCETLVVLKILSRWRIPCIETCVYVSCKSHLNEPVRGQPYFT